MFFFKSYKNSALATFISILSALSLVFAIISIVSFFTAGMKDSSNLIWGAAFVAIWFGARKLAAFIAAKKGK